MGKPATDWFCENGHHVDSAAHHHFCPLDLVYEQQMYADYCENPPEVWVPSCQHCGSTKLNVICEWDDPDYWDKGDCDVIVPHAPIRHDDEEREDHRGNNYFVKVPIYDVSKLFPVEHHQ